MWFALVYRVGMLTLMLWLTGFCIVNRVWVGLAVTSVLVVAQGASLVVFTLALRSTYGGLRKVCAGDTSTRAAHRR